MAAESERTILCKWDDGVEYPFVVDIVLASSHDNENVRTRMKDVFLGVFPDESRCPPGVEAGALYCLKNINTDESLLPRNVKLSVPSTREQYDMFPFKGTHFREYKAKNKDAQVVIESLNDSGKCYASDNCWIVEPVYGVMDGQGSDIEQMTIWERLEYMRQVIEALLELQDDKNRVAGRLVLAHRDLKIENTLVLRYCDNFKVILVDMASVLFYQEENSLWLHDDVMGVPQGSGPHQTCAKILTSPANTPPEQVIRGEPQSEKIDVFALGGILASLFGICRRGQEYDRNPIMVFHMLHGWPGNARKNKSASADANGEGASKVSREAFSRRYEENREWDRADPGTEIGWMERDLANYQVRVEWGMGINGSYNVKDHILKKVQQLFRRCTRIDPRMRISLREMLDEIQDLMRFIPEERNYCNAKLYLAKECVHLYDLNGAGNNNLSYGIYTHEAAAMSRTAIRCSTFHSAGVYGLKEGTAFEAVFRDDSLAEYVKKLSATERSESRNVAHALINLLLYYIKYRHEAKFDGEIRIFTNGLRMQDFWGNCGAFSVSDILDELEKLFDLNVQVRVYCPENCQMPELPDERFRWQKTSAFLGGGRQPRSAPGMGWEQRRPEPERPTAAPQGPRIEDSYICGEEGLYLLSGRHKVYVSKRRR